MVVLLDMALPCILSQLGEPSVVLELTTLGRWSQSQGSKGVQCLQNKHYF